ncbi:formamidopyrimidine-DNA glycosylase isoform X2 [Olea europaea subsp. europaea]|uniref:Formamidopyrimidine-DNA glycosylase isoform X2 n=1 Tax=Olea europaea subsp. europaea TaxID=158383 RepID=A0A8S0SZ60_OLEEU|nr:formamidopyrimidine-DNA glycosylase isoform X2 [Olea europaea subsp. europaea]
MPELPEVEAARLAIVEHCVGKKIMKSLVANDSKVIDGVSPRDLEAELVGKAHRKDKNMWLQLDSPPFPSFQFGRTGAIYIKGFAVTKYKWSAVKDTDEWPSKYFKLFVGSFISGIGNWMADEVLYQARIHPLQTAASMSKESCAVLLKCINEVTKFAVKVEIDSSHFPVEWMFHFVDKRPGKVNGKKIEHISAGGGMPAYVPELQKLSGNQARKVAGESLNNIEESGNEEATPELHYHRS